MIILNEVEQMEEMSIAMQNYLELIYELSLDGKKLESVTSLSI